MHKKLKAIAIDDEFRALEVIERYVSKIDFLEWCGAFKNALEGLSESSSIAPDLVFLDINMPDISGVALARLLKPDQQVIFTTAYSDYAVQGFELSATDYLLKPIEFDRFLQACLKAKEKYETGITGIQEPASWQKEIISIKSSTRIERIDLNEILFFEKLGNDLIVRLKRDREVKTRMTMAELSQLVPASRFCRVHKSFVVAIDKVDTVESHQLIIDGRYVPIGRSYKDELLKRI